MRTIAPTACSVRWRSLTRTTNWSARRTCSPGAPSSSIRRDIGGHSQRSAYGVTHGKSPRGSPIHGEPDRAVRGTDRNRPEGRYFRDFGKLEPENVPRAFFQTERLPLVTADEYLSGNVRQKLKQVRELIKIYLLIRRKKYSRMSWRWRPCSPRT